MKPAPITFFVPQPELFTLAQQVVVSNLEADGWLPICLEQRGDDPARTCIVLDRGDQRARVLRDGVLLYVIEGGLKT